MEIYETSNITVIDASWDVVRACLGGDRDNKYIPGFTNFPCEFEGEWQSLVRQALEAAHMDSALAGLAVLQSTKPVSSAGRIFHPVEGAKVPYITDPMGGRWNILLPCNLQFAEWESGGSYSKISIKRTSSESWNVTGSFPVECGERYEGDYYGCFDSGVRLAKLREDNKEDVPALLKERKNRWLGLVEKLVENIVDSDDFPSLQDWGIDLNGNYTVASEGERAALWRLSHTLKLDIELGFPGKIQDSRDGAPVYAMSVIPPEGWDDDLADRLGELGVWSLPTHRLPVLPLATPPAEEMPIAY